MNSTVEKLTNGYIGRERDFIYRISKSDVIASVDQLKEAITSMEDFDHFPEGSTGVILFALMHRGAAASADIGDFGYFCQGVQKIISASEELLRAETKWFH